MQVLGAYDVCVPGDVFALQRDSPVRDENSPLQRWPCRVEKGVRYLKH